MKAHFIGSLEGDRVAYKKIVNLIIENGFDLVTDHSISRSIDQVEKESKAESELYAKKMSAWIKKADIIVIEATISSLGAGFEISTALQLGKPVIVLYRHSKGNEPHVLKGQNDDKLQVLSYDSKTLNEVLKLALDYATDQMDTRFNFFISPKIANYLDWIAKKKKTPRAVYLRRMIEKDMESNKEYSK